MKINARKKKSMCDTIFGNSKTKRNTHRDIFDYMKIRRFKQSYYEDVPKSMKEVLNTMMSHLSKKYGDKNFEKISIEENDIKFDYPSGVEDIKKVCVLFSGGCDSLSLVLRHLENGDNVALCHIMFRTEESFTAYCIYRMLKKIYGNKVLGFYKLFNPIYINNGEDLNGYGQQPFAAFYAAWIPRCLKVNCTSVESAYVMNDDAISYTKELKAIYNNTIALKRNNEIKLPPYKFPLSKTKHEENIEYIKDIEYKYDVVFPVGSSESPCLNGYHFKIKRKIYDIYFYNCEVDPKCNAKENKKNSTKGYIIYDEYFENDIEELYPKVHVFPESPKDTQLMIDFYGEEIGFYDKENKEDKSLQEKIEDSEEEIAA